MKKLVFLGSLVLIALASCRKNDKSYRNMTTETFPGAYRWVVTDGGLGALHYTPATEGYNMTYTFNADSSLTILRGTSTTVQHYHTGSDNSIALLDSNFIPDQFTYYHTQDTLALMSQVTDGFNYIFVRMP